MAWPAWLVGCRRVSQRIPAGMATPKKKASPAPSAVSVIRSVKVTSSTRVPAAPLTSMTMMPDPAGAMYQRLVRTAIIAAMAATVTTASAVSAGPRRSSSAAATTPANVATVRPMARLVSKPGSGRMMNIAAAAAQATCTKSSRYPGPAPGRPPR